MPIANRWRGWLAGAAIGLILTLLIVPQTRGILRVQLLSLFEPNPASSFPVSSSGTSTDASTFARIASKFPDDYQIQLARVANVGPTDGLPPPSPRDCINQIEALEALKEKFPDNVAIDANVLRLLCMLPSTVQNRPEGALAVGVPWPGSTAKDLRTQAALPPFPYAFYDQTSADGEKLDPDNGYFPLMRAAGLFGSRKDEAALAAIHRAGSKPFWREYYTEQTEGDDKIKYDEYGAHLALGRLASSAAMLFPHYALLRNTARIALYDAMQAEKSGDARGGLSIRDDVMRCGALMRVQSGTLIGSLVGIAISFTSIDNPGGTLVKYDNLAPEQRATARRYAFTTYLQSNGFGDHVLPDMVELDAGKAVRKIVEPGLDDSQKDWTALIYSWLMDLALLTNVFALFLLYGSCFFLVLWLKLDVPRPITPHLRIPSMSGFLLGLAWTVWEPFLGFDPFALIVICLFVSVAVIISLPSIVRGNIQSRKVILERVGCLTAVSALTCLFGILLIWTGSNILSFGYLQLSMDLAGQSNSQTPPILAFIALIPIYLFLIGLWISCVKRRVPIVSGIIMGIKNTAITTACIFLMVYGGAFLRTISLERTVNNQIDRQYQQEGAYLAELGGKVWPGPTDWSPIMTH